MNENHRRKKCEDYLVVCLGVWMDSKILERYVMIHCLQYWKQVLPCLHVGAVLCSIQDCCSETRNLVTLEDTVSQGLPQCGLHRLEGAMLGTFALHAPLWGGGSWAWSYLERTLGSISKDMCNSDFYSASCWVKLAMRNADWMVAVSMKVKIHPSHYIPLSHYQVSQMD